LIWLNPRSIRARSIVAGLALLLLLAGVGAVAVWRAQSERDARTSLQLRSLAVQALEGQQGQVYLIGTYTALSSIVDDPTPFINSYYDLASTVTDTINKAHDAIAATGDDTAAIDQMQADAQGILQYADDILAQYPQMTRDQRQESARLTANDLWPKAGPMIGELNQIVQDQQSKLVSEQKAADRTSQISLALLITLSALSFFVAAGILATFIWTLVRPLGLLQKSVRAIISGDLEARAPESGPEELASVARDVNEMTQALLDRTERLVKSEQRFRDVLDISRDVVYKLNMNTRTYDYISPSTSDLLGFTPDEVVEMGLDGVWARFHPDDAATLGAPLADSVDGLNPRQAFSIEYRWRVKDSDYRWFSDDRSFLRDSEGNVEAVVGTVRDITQRRAAEEALRESEERFRSLSASAPIGIFSLDVDGRFTYGNNQLLQTFDLELEGLLGRFWSFNIHPDDRKAAVEEGMRRLAKAETYTFEYRVVRKNGDSRWVRTVSNALLNKDGNITSHVGAAEDITERKRAEDALRESEERFRTLSASAPVGIFLMNHKNQIVYMNDRLKAINGTTREGGPSEELALAVHPDDRDDLFKNWASSSLNGGEFTAEFRMLTPAKETRWLRMHISRLASGDGGEGGGVVGTVEDITPQKTAEEQMQHRIDIESAVAQTSSLLTGSEDLAATLNLSMRMLGMGFGADLAHVFTLADRTRMRCIGEWHSPESADAKSVHDFEVFGFPWSSRLLLKGAPIIVHDLAEMPLEAAPEKAVWQSIGVQSIVIVPLMSDGRITGNITLNTVHEKCTWREEDVRLLGMAADSISSFMERQRAGEEKHRAYESILFLLATAAEARDPYTEHHLQRVRGYAETIALELGLSPEEASEVGLFALLHDLGKIRVPDSILIKPGPLSEEEWQIMRKHTIWGEEMLPDDPWFKTAREITRWHHESWNGTGYPDGLHGDMIPIHTAIVSVADGFDAMTSRRPYKAPWPPTRAIREIIKEKGKRYSPAVVDAFRRSIEKGAIERTIVGSRERPGRLGKAA
jgi:PAS domain S-box-containing protein